MESTHTIIESVHEGTISPDDAVRVLWSSYVTDGSEPSTAAQLESFLQDMIGELGAKDDQCEFVDFEICGDCQRLILWDDQLEVYRHLDTSCSLINA